MCAFASACAPSPASRAAYVRERCRTIVSVALKFSATLPPLTLPTFICIAFAARKNDNADDNKGDRSWHSCTREYAPISVSSLTFPAYLFSYSFFGYKRCDDNIVERAPEREQDPVGDGTLKRANYSVFPLEIRTMVIVVG